MSDGEFHNMIARRDKHRVAIVEHHREGRAVEYVIHSGMLNDQAGETLDPTVLTIAKLETSGMIRHRTVLRESVSALRSNVVIS